MFALLTMILEKFLKKNNVENVDQDGFLRLLMIN